MYVYELCVAVSAGKRICEKSVFGSQSDGLSNRRYVVDNFLGEGGFKRACLLMRGDNFGGRSFGSVARAGSGFIEKKDSRTFVDLFYRTIPIYHKRNHAKE